MLSLRGGDVVGTDGNESKRAASRGLAGDTAESVESVEYVLYVEIGLGTSGFSFFGDLGEGHESANEGVALLAVAAEFRLSKSRVRVGGGYSLGEKLEAEPAAESYVESISSTYTK